MVTPNPIQILIADDHAMLRKGLATFLMSYSDLKLVGEAANGEEALQLCDELHPDIILMDLMMPIMSGITATHIIRQAHPKIQVIILTSFGQEHLIKSVLEAGAISYLFKKVSAEDLANAIRAAYAGFSTFAPEVTDILVNSIDQSHSSLQELTLREQEVLALLVKGMGNNEIANDLIISVATTKSHVRSILAKFGVTSRIEVIAMMIEDSFKLEDFYIK